MNEAQQLGQILTQMGSDANTVAATLKAAGVQGVRNTVRFLNPIARYVQASLRVDDYAFDLIQPGILRMIAPDGTRTEVPLPQPVADFLPAFDAGNYPELELKTT